MNDSLTNSDHDVIWEILVNFDFDRVHQVMEYLGWLWTTKNEPRVPDVNELRSLARSHLMLAITGARENDKQWAINSGGLEATAEIDPDGRVWASLRFILTDWDNYE